MKKFAQVALIGTSENTRAQLIDDTTNGRYWFVKTAAGGVKVLGPIDYGKTVRYSVSDPQFEVRNAVLIGGATVEVVAASTRYRVEIWNTEADYEGKAQGPQIYAYTTGVLSGTAATDRTNVYTALASKINAYAGNNCIAYGLTKFTYTGGTSTGNAATNFVIGETVTQETSTLTAQVAACSIATGTFADDNATGSIWVYNWNALTAFEEGAKTLTAGGTRAATLLLGARTNCVVTATFAGHYQGLVVVDDAGYFTSTKSRGGINRVSVTAGFATATATTIIAGKYSLGDGTDMLVKRPVYDIGNQALISGDLQYDFSDTEVPVAGQYYYRFIIDVADGDEDALDARRVASIRQYVLWFNATTSDHYDDILAALITVAAK